MSKEESATPCSLNSNLMNAEEPMSLLTMLAQVASDRLTSEPQFNTMSPDQSLDDDVLTKSIDNKQTVARTVTLAETTSMSDSTLLKLFSIFTADEIKRQFSYKCCLDSCEKYMTSFASDCKARVWMKGHLRSHIESLKKSHKNTKSYRLVTLEQLKSTQPGFHRSSKPSNAKRVRKKSEKENSSSTIPVLNVYNNVLNDISGIFLPDGHSIGGEKKFISSGENISSIESFNLRNFDSDLSKSGDSLNALAEVSVKIWEDQVNSKVKETFPDSIGENKSTKIDDDYDEIRNKMEYRKSATATLLKSEADNHFERDAALRLIEDMKSQDDQQSRYECKICLAPRVFTAPSSLLHHYKSHAGIRPYTCKICRGVFTRQHSLNYHMLIHKNETRFTCEDCGRGFRHPAHFKEHRRRHTGESPFVCPEDCCRGLSFKTRNTFKRHMRTIHAKLLTTQGNVVNLFSTDDTPQKNDAKNRLRNFQNGQESGKNGEHVFTGISNESLLMESENNSERHEKKLRNFGYNLVVNKRQNFPNISNNNTPCGSIKIPAIKNEPANQSNRVNEISWPFSHIKPCLPHITHSDSLCKTQIAPLGNKLSLYPSYDKESLNLSESHFGLNEISADRRDKWDHLMDEVVNLSTAVSSISNSNELVIRKSIFALKKESHFDGMMKSNENSRFAHCNNLTEEGTNGDLCNSTRNNLELNAIDNTSGLLCQNHETHSSNEHHIKNLKSHLQSEKYKEAIKKQINKDIILIRCVKTSSPHNSSKDMVLCMPENCVSIGTDKNVNEVIQKCEKVNNLQPILMTSRVQAKNTAGTLATTVVSESFGESCAKLNLQVLKKCPTKVDEC